MQEIFNTVVKIFGQPWKTKNFAALADIVGADNFSTGQSTLSLHSHDESYHRPRVEIFRVSELSFFKQIELVDKVVFRAARGSGSNH